MRAPFQRDSHHRLVMTGPCARVRFPIYTAVILSGIGLALTYLAPVLLLHALRVRAEEDLLLRRFGQVYQDYLDRTGRLLPRLRPPRHRD